MASDKLCLLSLRASPQSRCVCEFVCACVSVGPQAVALVWHASCCVALYINHISILTTLIADLIPTLKAPLFPSAGACCLQARNEARRCTCKDSLHRTRLALVTWSMLGSFDWVWCGGSTAVKPPQPLLLQITAGELRMLLLLPGIWMGSQ
jgi:hypothetical protein